MAEGSTEAPRWPGVEVPPGSESKAWHVRSGVPQEPGRPCRLRTLNRNEGKPVDTNPLACGGRARPATGANVERKERYRQAKATKCGGMDGRESERLVVPMKPGN